MAIELASYRERNRLGVYYFRRVIPFDLRRFFAFREFERSTGTTTRREANVLVRRMGASADCLFDRLREMAKNPGDAIAFYRVSTRVGNARNQRVDLIAAI